MWRLASQSERSSVRSHCADKSNRVAATAATNAAVLLKEVNIAIQELQKDHRRRIVEERVQPSKRKNPSSGAFVMTVSEVVHEALKVTERGQARAKTQTGDQGQRT